MESVLVYGRLCAVAPMPAVENSTAVTPLLFAVQLFCENRQPMPTEEFEWSCSRFFITSTLVPQKFWQAVSIDIRLDRVCVLRTGGVFKVTGSHSVEFACNGAHHCIKLSWGYANLRSLPIKVEIDGEVQFEGRVVIRNWPLTFVPWLALGCLILYLL